MVFATAAGFLIYQHSEREEQQSKTKIPISQLTLRDITLKSTGYGGYELTGRVTNNSNVYRLNGIQFKITMRDCTSEGREQSCIIIRETSEHAYLGVPPMQARDFRESVYFSGDRMKPRHRLVWDYEVVYTKYKSPLKRG